MPDDEDPFDLDAGTHRPPGGGVGTWARGGLRSPGPVGVDEAEPMQAVTRTVTAVTKDWVPPTPTDQPAIRVGGKTLAQAGQQLNARGRWGVGGGFVRAEPTPRGSNPNVTVALHGNLVLRMPVWTEYSKASSAARAEWDRMVATLRKHEHRHVEIAIEELDNLAANLQGADVTQIAKMVTQANTTMNQRQRELDHDTDGGMKPGVTYGDVFLDTSIE
jgi:Bacterial protein of unknown function (DUF922)